MKKNKRDVTILLNYKGEIDLQVRIKPNKKKKHKKPKHKKKIFEEY